MNPPATALLPPPPPAEAVAPPVRARGVELLGELSGSGYRRTPGLVRRGDGQTLQMTPLLYRLLGLVDGRRDAADLARELGDGAGMRFEADDVDYLLEEKLRPLGVLAEPDGSTRIVAKANPLLALRLKFVISNPAVTRRVTSPFAWLFRPAVVVPSVLVFLLTCWWVLFDRGLASAAHEAIYSPELLLAVFALTLVSAGFHEFGHAAACRYGGATPGAMGAGLYLVWPAFYTDVDDSYRLSRWGRLRVDLGGLYFNALFAVAMAGLALITGKDAFLLVVVTQLLQMLRQLAPFMRADGYHILADLTGVPDLFFHIKPTLVGLWPPNWFRPESRVLRPWARVVVTTWVLVVVPVLLGLLAFGVYLLPRLAATAWNSAGLHWASLTAALGDGDPATAAVRWLSLVALFVPVAAITYLLVRVVRRTAVSVWSGTEGRPRRRAAALVGAALLVALVGWAWWPNGQYAPVTGEERGTVPSIIQAGSGAGPAAISAEPVTAPAPAPAPAPAQQQATTTTARPSASVQARPAGAPTPAGALPPQSAPAQVGIPAGQGPGRPGGMPPPVQVIVTPPAPEEPRAEWPFPFPRPPELSDGDNRAIAVNTVDGSTVSDVSYSLVLVSGGDPVPHRNEAWALASCRDCKTVAVAFQVVLVVGHSNTFLPVNTAAALNYECEKCISHAIAVQLVASVTREPDAETTRRLAEAMAPLDAVRASVEQLTLTQIYAQLLTVERSVLQILSGSGSSPETVGRSDEVAAADTSEAPGPSAAGPPADSADHAESPLAPSSEADQHSLPPALEPEEGPGAELPDDAPEVELSEDSAEEVAGDDECAAAQSSDVSSPLPSGECAEPTDSASTE